MRARLLWEDCEVALPSQPFESSDECLIEARLIAARTAGDRGGVANRAQPVALGVLRRAALPVVQNSLGGDWGDI